MGLNNLNNQRARRPVINCLAKPITQAVIRTGRNSDSLANHKQSAVNFDPLSLRNFRDPLFYGGKKVLRQVI